MIGNTDNLIAYAAGRGVTLTQEKAAIALQLATDYLNGLCWIGTKADPSQSDAWPRVAADGTAIPTPETVIEAAYKLAITSSKGVDLQPTFAGKQVLRERVEGAVDVTYAESTMYNGPVFPWLDAMIKDFTICEETSGINFSVFRG